MRFAYGWMAHYSSTTGRRTNRRSITPRSPSANTICASSIDRWTAGWSCAWTSYAGQAGVLDPQGHTSIAHGVMREGQHLGLAVLNLTFEYDDRVPVARQGRPPAQPGVARLRKRDRHRLSPGDVSAREHAGSDVVLHEDGRI